MHQHSSLSSTIRSTTIAALFMGSAALAPGVFAQAGNDVPGNEIGPAHPAHIHKGTCDDLGDIAYPLFDVTEMGVDVGTPTDNPPSTPADGGGSGEDDSFATNTIVLDVKLDDLLDGDYAINVHESSDAMKNYIACGNIEGDVEDDTLLVPLEELNDSGFTGEAALVANPDDQTSVTITLTPTDRNGTPAPSPQS